MNRFDIINRIGDKYRIGNTETGEFSYAQALKTVGKDINYFRQKLYVLQITVLLVMRIIKTRHLHVVTM